MSSEPSKSRHPCHCFFQVANRCFLHYSIIYIWLSMCSCLARTPSVCDSVLYSRQTRTCARSPSSSLCAERTVSANFRMPYHLLFLYLYSMSAAPLGPWSEPCQWITLTQGTKIAQQLAELLRNCKCSPGNNACIRRPTNYKRIDKEHRGITRDQ